MGPQLPVVDPKVAEDALYRLVAPLMTDAAGSTSGTTGQWHALLPALMHSAQGAVLASAADAAISMAGINPGRLAYMTATTRQDWTVRPPDEELSTTTLPADS